MPTPDRTSLSQIVEAGRDLLEESGPAGVTMQAVAARVGVRAPSLYKRVRDLDALREAVNAANLDDLADQVLAADTSLEALARAFRAFAHARPEGFRLLFTAGAPVAALDRASVPVIARARELVGEEHALDAARLVTSWATGFVSMELAGAFRLGGDVDQAFEYGVETLKRGLAAPQPDAA